MLKLLSKNHNPPRSLFITGINPKVNLEYIGMGGFGCVFEGDYEGRPVALKGLYNVHDEVCKHLSPLFNR
jgi:hypothetical protein